MVLYARDNQGLQAWVAEIQVTHVGEQRPGLKVTEKENHLQLWPAGGATAQLHWPDVASWLLLLWVSAPQSFFMLSKLFSTIGRFFPFFSSFPLSLLHPLLNARCAPCGDPGTALVGPIANVANVGFLVRMLAWRSSGNLMKMQGPGALEMAIE